MIRPDMKAKWFVRGDGDGFIGLFIDNLLQLLLIATLCPLVCGLPVALVTGSILPGAAMSIVVGNLFYSWQAWRLARRTGRDDVTAIPYGINTVSLVAFIFFIMAPVWHATHDARQVWQAGVFACMVSGLIEFGAAFCVDPLRRGAPRAALLSALAGIAITFISMGFAFQIFAAPSIALLPMLLIVVAFAARLKLPFGLPAGLVAILAGVGIAWVLRFAGIVQFAPPPGPLEFGFHAPQMDFPLLRSLFTSHGLWGYLTVILPMALFNILGSLQTLESAEAAGDRYETMPSLAMNGAGTILAAVFGSAFPTTLYIGHPGWKAMGARIGYSALNGLVISLVSLFGAVGAILYVMPIETALGILIWIGLVMSAQAFQETPRHHALAVAAGLIPSLAAWACYLIETTLRVAGTSLAAAQDRFGTDIYIRGVISLNQGFMITSMAFASIVAFSIDRRFVAAAVTCFLCSALSAIGLIHAYALTPAGIAPNFGLMAAPDFALAYALTGAFLLALHVRYRKSDDAPDILPADE